MIALGLVLVFWAYCNVNAGIMSEGLVLRVRNAAQAVNDRMSDEEVRRVFEWEGQVTDRKAWFEDYCGLFWARGIHKATGVNAFGSAGLGLLMCAWGIAEGIRRTRHPGPAVPA
jgi:hypothetical protein